MREGRGVAAAVAHGVAVALLSTAPALCRAGIPQSVADAWADPLGVTRVAPDRPPMECAETIDAANLLLADAATIAVCRHPQARAALAAVQGRRAALGTARSAWLPSITATAAYNQSHTVVRSRANPAALDTVNRASNTSLVLNQTLFDFGVRSANEERARFELLAVVANQSVALQEVLLNAVQSYVQVQAKKAALEAWGDALHAADETWHAAQAKRARGIGNVAEVLQAQSALSRVKLDQARATTEARTAVATLNAAMGIAIDATPQLPAMADAEPGEATVPALRTLLAEAEANHPAIGAADAQVASARSRVQGAKAEGLPSLALSAAYYDNGRPGTAQTDVRSRERFVGLVLNVPLFEGFGRTYKVDEAQAQLDSETAKRDLTRARISLEIAQSYETLDSERVSLKAARDLLESAAETYRAAQARFANGVADILELLTAQRDLANARQTQLQSMVAWRIATWKLWASLGRLDVGALDHVPVER